MAKHVSKLSDQAKEYAKEALQTLDRSVLIEMLEGIGVACYDEETEETFAEAIVDSIEAGDIEFDFSFAASKAYPNHIARMWLDIDDVWI